MPKVTLVVLEYDLQDRTTGRKAEKKIVTEIEPARADQFWFAPGRVHAVVNRSHVLRDEGITETRIEFWCPHFWFKDVLQLPGWELHEEQNPWPERGPLDY